MSSICFSCLHNMHEGRCTRLLADTHGTYSCNCPDGVQPPKGKVVPVTLQQLIDVGLNGFGLQLFVESVAAKKDANTFEPIRFSYKGILVTLEPDPDRPIDGRHQ
jgi:hypothetical protein